MSGPAFWQTGGGAPALLSPLEAMTRLATAWRVARPGWHAPVPVICCGNPGVGGSGKTPLCLDILWRLRRLGIDAHALTRGYGGRARGAVRVDPALHDAAYVGDEALLLAASAPTWVCADRAASARKAVAEGAQALVMDDGLQNPSLEKTCSLLVIDGGAGFGNGRLLPAGPLREPVRAAAARCRAAVLIGEDLTNALAALPPALPVYRARLSPGPDMLALRSQAVLAFAGIGRPTKFFESLREAGLQVIQARAFPDHHVYLPWETAALRAAAADAGAQLVTTAKDLARLPKADRFGIAALKVSLQWIDGDPMDRLLADLMGLRQGSASF